METTLRFNLNRISALALIASLAACGGAHNGALPQAAPSNAPSAKYTGQLANATFAIKIPAASTSARKPNYVSSGTLSLKFTLTAASALTTAQLAAFSPVVDNVTLGNSACPLNGGFYTCRYSIGVPGGTDSVTIGAYSATNAGGSLISQQELNSLTMTTGANNTFSFTFDLNAPTLALSALSGQCASSYAVSSGGTVGELTGSATTYNVSFTDPAGKSVSGSASGLPVITVNGVTASGTVTFGDGSADITVNNTAHSFTVKPNATNMNDTITVTAAPANSTGSSDGLTFSQTYSFTLKSGSTLPSNLLAVIEQTGASTRQINFFTVNTAGGTFSPWNPATLTNQNNDVDNPQDVLFDNNGDLLVANGGAGAPDYGNFACVPAGSISTGVNNASVLTSNIDDAGYLALNSDSSVVVGNINANATDHTDDFLLSGSYTAASSGYDVTSSNYGSTYGLLGVASLSGAPLAAGSYAAAFFSSANDTKVVVKQPNQTPAVLTDANLYDAGVAYDSYRHQIVTVNEGITGTGSSAFTTQQAVYLTDFTDGSPFTKTDQILIDDDGCYQSGTTPWAGCGSGNTANGYSDVIPSFVAASSSGYVAVAATDIDGDSEVWVYGNTSARAPLAGPIPFDAVTTSGGAGTTLRYGGGPVQSAGGGNIVVGLRWLTGSILAVALKSQSGGSATGAQGIYLYNVSAPTSAACTSAQATGTGCYDTVLGSTYPATFTQLGFQAISNIPHAMALKP